MTAPSEAAQQTKAERFLGLGRPTPRSPYWVWFSALLVTLFGGWILWVLVARGWEEQGFVSLGLLLAMLSQLCDTGGGFLYLRRGAEWGRALRVLGFAVFWPLSMAFWTIGLWLQSSGFFVLPALLVGFFVAWVALRAGAALWRDARGRGGR